MTPGHRPDKMEFYVVFGANKISWCSHLGLWGLGKGLAAVHGVNSMECAGLTPSYSKTG